MRILLKKQFFRASSPALPAESLGRKRKAGLSQSAVDRERGLWKAPIPSREIPEEIAFLEEYGVPIDKLHYASALAERQGVSADAALLAEGLIDERLFYEALAHRLRVPFIEESYEIEPPEDPALACDGGFVQLSPNPEGLQWLFAPRGAAITRLLVAAVAAPAVSRLAITTRANFVERVQRGLLPSASRDAGYTAERVDPHLCARRGACRGLVSAAIAALACVCVLLLQPIIFLQLASALPLAALFLLSALLRLFACAASFERRDGVAEIADADLPVFTIVAPLYREARVARQLARAIDRLDYPRAKLQALFVVEHDDPETERALRQYAPRTPHQILTAPKGWPKTKPRALDIAAVFASGELLVVYDAEDLPHPKQLRQAAAIFAQAPAELACLQASLAIENGEQSWLAAFFALDYAALFDVFNRGIAVLGMPFFLGGTSNHFRVEALRKVGFWDAFNVTEDADLGLRLARAGYRVETFASHTFEEAPVTLNAWLNQRSRWMKGWMQTAIVHCRRLDWLFADLGVRNGLAVLAMFTGGFVGPLLGPFLTALLCARALFGDLLTPQTPLEIGLSTLWCFLALSGQAAVLWPLLVAMKRRRLERFAPVLLLTPVWQLLLCVAAWRALAELWAQPYLWRKTEHGRVQRGRPVAAPTKTREV